MKDLDVAVIGGRPAGFAAAMSARNTYPDRSIALIRTEQIARIPSWISHSVHDLDSESAMLA